MKWKNIVATVLMFFVVTNGWSINEIQPKAFNGLVCLSINGEVIGLQDGSKWRVKSEDRKKVMMWVQSDTIFIKPLYSCLPQIVRSSNFIIHNRTINETVTAKLMIPSAIEDLSLYIVCSAKIHSVDCVILSDKSVWRISMSDHFFSPREGNLVILGVNNHWRTADYPHILIIGKEESNEYFPASFVGMFNY